MFENPIRADYRENITIILCLSSAYPDKSGFAEAQLILAGKKETLETVIQFPKGHKRLILLPEKRKYSVFHTDNCILAVLRPSQQVLRIQFLNYWSLLAVLRPSQQVGENTPQRPKLLFISINDQFAVLRARRGRSQQVLSWKDY